MKIGIFDSGLGGLAMLRAITRALPSYDYVYYGDTANLPYGDKTNGEIYELSKRAITELFDRDCQLVIVACNTASSEVLRKLQDTFVAEQYPDRKVLGVIIPTIEEVCRINPKRAILLATERTVSSGKYQIELDKFESDIELLAHATKELVPLIEDHKKELAATLAAGFLEDLAVGEGEVVILGCTHYSFLKKILREQFPEVIFLAQDEILPTKLAEYLQHHPEIEEALDRNSERKIHLTEHREGYDRLAAEFLGGSYLPAEDE